MAQLWGLIIILLMRKCQRPELPGYSEWPNPLLGYGALCVRDSLPV